MWVYDIFPGVQLMVVDFAIESCFRGSGKKMLLKSIIAKRVDMSVLSIIRAISI